MSEKENHCAAHKRLESGSEGGIRKGRLIIGVGPEHDAGCRVPARFGVWWPLGLIPW